jgi:hypothetical protein
MEKGHYYHFKAKYFDKKFVYGNIKYEPTYNSATLYTLIPDQQIYILKIIDNTWCFIDYYNSKKRQYEKGYIMHTMHNTNGIDYIINPYFVKLDTDFSQYD